MITKPADVDVSLFQVGRLEDSSTVSSQKIAWINYDANKRKLHIQTPVFVTETYGIPRQGQYYQTDKSRAFVKLPFSHEQALHSDEMDYGAMEQFYRKLLEIDNHVGPEEFKLKLFGDKMANKSREPANRAAPREQQRRGGGGQRWRQKGVLPTALHKREADALQQ